MIAPGQVDWRFARTHPRYSPHNARYRLLIGKLWPLGIVLLAPGIAVLSILIIAGLLGFFVAWLGAVGCLFTVTLISDLVRASWRYAHPPVGAVRQAVG